MFDDLRALTVETDVPAQIVVNPLVRQRAQEDDERKRRPQQLGTEDGGPIEDVKSLQSRDKGLDPRSPIASASGIDLPTSAASSRVVVRARRRRITGASRQSHTGVRSRQGPFLQRVGGVIAEFDATNPTPSGLG